MSKVIYAWCASVDPMFPAKTSGVCHHHGSDAADVVAWYDKECEARGRFHFGEVLAIDCESATLIKSTCATTVDRFGFPPHPPRPQEVVAQIERHAIESRRSLARSATAEPHCTVSPDWCEEVEEVARMYGAEATEERRVRKEADAKGTPVPRQPVARAAVIRRPVAVRDVGTIPTNERDQEAMGFPPALLVTQGQGVKVLVIDTGCNRSHPCLAGRVPRVIDCTGHGTDVPDYNGHGTFCTSQIISALPSGAPFGTARMVQLAVARVLHPREGWGTDSQIARGIRAGISLGVKVISASIGGTDYMPLTAAAVADATAAGILIVAAAGNGGAEPLDADYPGRLHGVLCVGSATIEGTLSRFSNRGPSVDVLALGERQAGAVGETSYGRWDGTSMATPHAAAAVALVMGAWHDIHHEWPRPEQVSLMMVRSARGGGTYSDRLPNTCGMIHAGDAVGSIGVPPPVVPPVTPPFSVIDMNYSDAAVGMAAAVWTVAQVCLGRESADLRIRHQPAD